MKNENRDSFSNGDGLFRRSRGIISLTEYALCFCHFLPRDSSQENVLILEFLLFPFLNSSSQVECSESQRSH